MCPDGVVLTSLKRITTPGGEVLHGMKVGDIGFAGFGEAYFSTVEFQAIKGWKRHHSMTMNIIVPLGSIKFVLFDDRKNSSSDGVMFSFVLSKENYCRVTVPPKIWMAFQGLGREKNILLNIADICHAPEEADSLPLNEISYAW